MLPTKNALSPLKSRLAWPEPRQYSEPKIVRQEPSESRVVIFSAGFLAPFRGKPVLNAGPTSALAAPNQGCSISAISRATNVVTVTCSTAHNIPVGSWDHAQGIQITGVTDSTFNGTFDVASAADGTHFTYGQTASNAVSSGGTASMQFGYAHGAVGRPHTTTRFPRWTRVAA